MNSCVNSPEDGPVGPKHVEIQQYINKIEIVTSVGFYSIPFDNVFLNSMVYIQSNPLTLTSVNATSCL